MTTAAFYARISLPGEDERETGLDRQIADCRSFIAGQGWTLTGEFVDDGKSAFLDKVRPAFERLLHEMAAGKFDQVVAWRADRLSRKPRDAVRLLDAAKAGRVVIRGVADGTNTGEPMGGFTFGLMVGIAEVESASISARVIRASNSVRLTGKKWGGMRAYGHSPDGIELVEEEAAVVREIARRIIAGDTAMGIYRDLSSRGVRSVQGAEWLPTKLIALLRSPRLCGRRWADEGKQTLSAQGMAEILDEATWRSVQAVLDRRRASSKVANRTPARRLLTNIAVCGRCGEPLKSKSLLGHKDRPKQERYTIYGCWPLTTKPMIIKPPGCGRLFIRADRTDELVSALMIQALEAPDLVSRLAALRPRRRTVSIGDRLAAERERLVKLETRMLIGDVDASAEAQRRALTTMRERVTALERQLAEDVVPSVLNPALGAGAAIYWNKATLPQRRAIVRALTKKVEVLPLPVGVQARWRADRLVVEWRV